MNRNSEQKSAWRLRLNLFNRTVLRDFLNKIKDSEQFFMLLGGAIIGIAGGYGSVIFKWMIAAVQKIFWGGWADPAKFLAGVDWYWIIGIPAFGGLLTGLIVRYIAEEARGPGIPGVLEANILNGGKLRFRVPFAKSLAAAINIGTGGSVGREGPIVQIGSSFGSIFGQLTKVDSSKTKIFVACGAAAAVAGTFDTPIAGVLFSLEVILGDIGLSYLSPIVVSSVISTVVAHQYINQFQFFQVPTYELVSAWELIPYAGLGILTGLVALLFEYVLDHSETLFDSIQIPSFLKPMTAGLLLGIIALVVPQILGVGYEIINLALVDNIAWTLAILLLFGKIIATSLMLGGGGSGGIFAPALFMGAMAGLLIGNSVHALFPGITAHAGAYALVGMAGVIGAAAHAPLTAILIIFELTNDYAIILPLMITTVIAVFLSRRIRKESIYTHKLVRKGIKIFHSRDMNVLHSMQVSAAMRRSVETIHAETSLEELMSLMTQSNHAVFFVLNREQELSGYITLRDLHKLVGSPKEVTNSALVLASDIEHPCDFALKPDDTLSRAMELFVQEEIEELPVVKNDDVFRPVATLWREDVIEAYNREVFRRSATSGIGDSITSRGITEEPIEILHGFSIAERDVPDELAGKTLSEAQVREEWGVEIFLVHQKRPGTEVVKEIMPTGDYRLERHDSVIIFGETGKVRQFGYIEDQ